MRPAGCRLLNGGIGNLVTDLAIFNMYLAQILRRENMKF